MVDLITWKQDVNEFAPHQGVFAFINVKKHLENYLEREVPRVFHIIKIWCK